MDPYQVVVSGIQLEDLEIEAKREVDSSNEEKSDNQNVGVSTSGTKKGERVGVDGEKIDNKNVGLVDEDNMRHQMKQEFLAYRLKLSKLRDLRSKLITLGVLTGTTESELNEMKLRVDIAEPVMMSDGGGIEEAHVTVMKEMNLELDKLLCEGQSDLEKAEKKILKQQKKILKQQKKKLMKIS